MRITRLARLGVAVLLLGGTLATMRPVAASRPQVQFVCFDRVGQQTRPDRRGVIRGTRGADVIISFKREVVVFGGGGNDRICTGKGNDFVAGGAGNDLIEVAGGADRVAGGRGSDYVNGRIGNDRLEGGHGGSDTLVGASGNDRLFGGDDSIDGDYLFGGAGDDQLTGGDGSPDPDVLVGGEGADVLDGGSGPADEVSFAFERQGVEVDLSATTAVAPTGDTLAGIEDVTGSRFADLLRGGDGPNELRGNDGDDSIFGAGDFDTVDGGEGDDGLDGGDGSDRVSFLDAPRAVQADLAAGSASGSGLDVLAAFENMLGSAYDDLLAGDDFPNEVDGSRGNDELLTRGGDDILSSGNGDAGEGEDLCFESLAQNCELLAPTAPRAESTILFPEQAVTYPVGDFRRIEGEAALSGSGLRQFVALRRMSGSGCYWWDHRHGVMVPWHCVRPLWIEVDLARNGRWSLRVPSPVQLLNAGAYQVRTQTRDAGIVETSFRLPYNLVEFRLE